MKQLIQHYMKRLLLLVAMLQLLTKGKAQVSWDTTIANDVTVCLKPELLRIAVTVASAGSGSYFDVGMPTGFAYNGIAYQNTPSGNSISYSGKFGNRHRFSISGTPAAGSILRLWILQTAQCGTIGSSTFNDTIGFFNGTNKVNQITNSFNSTSASISITGTTNSPGSVTVGTTVTRSMSITNGGTGKTQGFRFVDKFASGSLSYILGSAKINPSGSNYSIPTNKIIIKSDSIIIDFDSATFVQFVSGADKYFDPSESFVLQYQVQPNTCGIGFSVTSNLYAWWGCPGITSSCQAASSNTGIGILTSGNPNLVFNVRSQAGTPLCYGTMESDTVLLRNTGSGAATNINISTFQAYANGTYLPTYLRNIDTGFIRYKIGKNGTWVKPFFSGIVSGGSTNYHSSCKGIARANFTVPSLAAGDTVFILITSTICPFNSVAADGCTGSYIAPRVPAITNNISYFDACGAIPFSSSNNLITTYGFSDRGHSTNAPAMVSPGQGFTLTYSLSHQSLSPVTTRAKVRYTINKPLGFTFDFSSGFPFFGTVAGVDRLPVNWDTANGTFEFRANQVSQGMTITLKMKAPVCNPPAISNGFKTISWTRSWSVDSTAPCSYIDHSCDITEVYLDGPVPCNLGVVKLDSFNSMRQNYGLPDNNNDRRPDISGTLDMSKVNSKLITNGDTLRVTWAGSVLGNTSGIHSKFEHIYALFYPSLNTFKSSFTPILSTVYLKRQTLPDTQWTTSGSWVNDTFKIDLTHSRHFLNNDSIWVVSKFVNKTVYTTGFSSTGWRLNPSLFGSHFPYPQWSDSSIRRTCGEKYDNINLRNSSANFGGVTTILNFTGCPQQIMQYQFTHVYENAGLNQQNITPFEYKPQFYPKRLALKFPLGYVSGIDSVNGVYTYTTSPNTNTTKTFFTLPYAIVGDSVILYVGNLFSPEGGSQFVSDDVSYFTLRFYMKSTCQAAEGIIEDARGLAIIGGAMSHITNFSPFITRTTSGGNLRSYKPSITINSSIPRQDVYSNIVEWPLTVRENVGRTAPFTWISFVSPSNKIIVDSLKTGSTIITKDANGFFRLGSFNANIVNYTIYARNTSCSADSILVYFGYDCSAYPSVTFNSSICSYTPGILYLSPKPAEIQTTVTALALTPSAPANSGSSPYGSSTIPDICAEMPVEITINSAQPGTIYNVHEILNIPNNAGSPGLSFKSGSGYIEWPLGTTPRAFSTAANSALSASGLTQLDFDLNQIDPSNFNTTSGLPGTGTAPSSNHRQAKLRFILKSNCSMPNGDQWTVNQNADAPCGGDAIGSNQTTSGYAILVNGVSNPYSINTTLNLDKNTIVGLNDSIKVTSILQKIGTASVSATDTIRIIFPTNSSVNAIKCFGTRCPSTTPTFIVGTSGVNIEYKLIVPGTLGNADTLRFETYIKSNPISSGCSQNNTILFKTTQQATLYCSSTGANCSSSQLILGQNSKTFAIVKPELNIINYSGSYLSGTPQFMYKYAGTIINTATAAGTSVLSGTQTVLETWWDVDYNNTFDPLIDRLVRTKTLTGAIPNNGGMLSFVDTFQYTGGLPPDPNRAMFTTIRTVTSPNCNCSPLVQSSLVVALPLEWLTFNVEQKERVAKLFWVVTEQEKDDKFIVQRLTSSNVNYMNLDTIHVSYSSITPVGYKYYDKKLSHVNGLVLYRIKHITNNGSTSESPVRTIKLSQHQMESIKIYPNPADRVIYVDFLETTEYSYILTSATGQVVLKGNEKNTQCIIPISHLPEGIYMLEIKNESNSKIEKVIISR